MLDHTELHIPDSSQNQYSHFAAEPARPHGFDGLQHLRGLQVDET